MTPDTFTGLLCPACIMIGYVMLIVALRETDAKFINRWDEEDDDDAE